VVAPPENGLPTAIMDKRLTGSLLILRVSSVGRVIVPVWSGALTGASAGPSEEIKPALASPALRGEVVGEALTERVSPTPS